MNMDDANMGFLVLHADAQKEGEGKAIPIYENFVVSPQETEAQPRFALSASGVGFLPIGDIQAVKAKPKTGKTLFMAVLAASALGCRDFGINPTSKNMKLLYADTEQNRRNTALFLKRVASILGRDREADIESRLTAISLRNLSDPSAKLDVLLSAVAHIRPQITIVDGIADLIQDFNDIGQSCEIISMLMKISQSYDTAIVNVLHTNKSRDDHNMKGHLGSMLLQKASDVFEVRKYGGGDFAAYHVDSRNAQIHPIFFHVKQNHDAPDIQITPKDAEMTMGTRKIPIQNGKDLPSIFHEIFNGIEGSENGLQYMQIVECCMTTRHVSDRTAKSYIKEATDSHILKKKGKTYYMT